MLKEWFEEVKSSSRNITRFTSNLSESYIYKGFKITCDNNNQSYYLQDVRHNDFYTDVKKVDLELMTKHGFIKGCDLVVIKNDEVRVKKYEKIMLRLMDSFNKSCSESRKKTLQNQINEATDLYFFYKSRLKQLKSKYNEE